MCGYLVVLGFPGGASGKEPTCHGGRHERYGFDPWVGKIPWRRTWQPTLVSEEPGGLQSPGSQRAGHHGSALACTHASSCPAAAAAKALQSCPALCDPMDCSPPGSSIHGILQSRILEWVAMPSSRGSSQPRDRTHISYVSCTDRRILYH